MNSEEVISKIDKPPDGACRFLVEMGGVDLPCGAGRLGLKRATGTFPSSLGFNSPLSVYRTTPLPCGRGVALWWRWGELNPRPKAF